MLKFTMRKDAATGQETMETTLTGKSLLTTPQLNKDTAFTQEERIEFNLLGKLPVHIETLDEQVQRTYKQYRCYADNLQKNIYLNNLHDKNQVLFYKMVSLHLTEILPAIYTPIVGTAVKQFSHEFRQPRGIYIGYPEMEHMDEILGNRTNPDIDVIVVSDGEGVLGIGDQGVGGMDIPVAKLMVYTLCGGIHHLRTLPIFLDVGTNNQTLLNDPLYLGWRHERIGRKDYDEFIGRFVEAIKKSFPKVFLQWEDFGRDNALRFLERFRDDICSFNDDIQGTGAVTLAAILAACLATKTELHEQRIVVFGSGSAGVGVSEQIRDAMISQGQTKDVAHNCFYLIDRNGLLIDSMEDLTPGQTPFARSEVEIDLWKVESDDGVQLLDVVKNAKPTILIGTSAVTGAFTQEVIEEMMKHTDRPIILPLSNPTDRVEATPTDLMTRTNNQALIATGSPFSDIDVAGKPTRVAQCNNALVFPGIGLGMAICKPSKLSDKMIWAACETLAKASPVQEDPTLPLLPALSDAQAIAKKIAAAIAKEAYEENLATVHVDDIEKTVEELFWSPHYPHFKRA